MRRSNGSSLQNCGEPPVQVTKMEPYDQASVVPNVPWVVAHRGLRVPNTRCNNGDGSAQLRHCDDLRFFGFTKAVSVGGLLGT